MTNIVGVHLEDLDKIAVRRAEFIVHAKRPYWPYPSIARDNGKNVPVTVRPIRPLGPASGENEPDKAIAIALAQRSPYPGPGIALGSSHKGLSTIRFALRTP